MNKALLATLLLASLGCAHEAPMPTAKAEPAPFAYQSSAPLEADVSSPTARTGLLSYRFTLRGHSGRVPGILTVPTQAEGKPAVILMLHGMGGKKEDLTAVAVMAAAAGYATVAIDAPLHGDRKVEGQAIIDKDPAQTRKHWVEAIIDWRRTIDFLESRDDIDSSRLILLGASMGGMMGAMLAGTDTRVDAAALLIAGGDWMSLFNGSTHPSVAVFDGMAKEDYAIAIKTHMSDIDPIEWVAKISPRPILFVNGTKDEIIPKASAQALIDAAKEPKEVVWDAVGHTISPLRLPKILDWIKTHTPKPKGGA